MSKRVAHQDATDTPVVSPKDMTTPWLMTLTVPNWANRLAIKGDVAWQHGDGDGTFDATDGNGYQNVPAETWDDVHVVAGGSFIAKAAADITFEFFFYHAQKRS